MSKKRPLMAREARSRLLVSRLLKNLDATKVVEKILRESREEGADRDIYIARLVSILVDVGTALSMSDKGKQQGVTFDANDINKAAARLLRLGYQLDGPKSHLRRVV